MRGVKVTKSKNVNTGKVYDYPVKDPDCELITEYAIFHQFMQEGVAGEMYVVAVVEYHNGKVETLPLSAIIFG